MNFLVAPTFTPARLATFRSDVRATCARTCSRIRSMADSPARSLTGSSRAGGTGALVHFVYVELAYTLQIRAHFCFGQEGELQSSTLIQRGHRQGPASSVRDGAPLLGK